jgi:hypothetical protein
LTHPLGSNLIVPLLHYDYDLPRKSLHVSRLVYLCLLNVDVFHNPSLLFPQNIAEQLDVDAAHQ